MIRRIQAKMCRCYRHRRRRLWSSVRANIRRIILCLSFDSLSFLWRCGRSISIVRKQTNETERNEVMSDGERSFLIFNFCWFAFAECDDEVKKNAKIKCRDALMSSLPQRFEIQRNVLSDSFFSFIYFDCRHTMHWRRRQWQSYDEKSERNKSSELSHSDKTKRKKWQCSAVQCSVLFVLASFVSLRLGFFYRSLFVCVANRTKRREKLHRNKIEME